MKFVLTLILVLASVIFCADAHGEISPVFVKGYNGAGNTNDRGKFIEHDAAGNIYVAGQSSDHSDFGIFLIKYNSAGTQLWAKTYENQLDPLVLGYFLDGAGNSYIVGYEDGKALILKYNSAGTLQWSRTRLFGAYGYATDVCVSNEGNIFVSGHYTEQNGQGAFIMKYNSAGTFQWSDTRMVNDFTLAYNIRMDANGNLYTTGVSENNDGKQALTIMKYNNAGQIQQFYQVPHNLLQGVDHLALTEIDAAGNIYLSTEAYFTDDLGDSDIWTVKISPAFQVVWSKRYDGVVSKDDEPYDMCIDANGSVYVVGKTYTSGVTKMDFVTIKYLSNGTMLWDAVHNGTVSDTDYAKSVVVDEAGNVYVTGRTENSSSGFDITTIKYGFYGNKQWETSFTGSDVDAAGDLTIDAQGNLYVTGEAKRFLNDDMDMVLIKYGSTVGIQQVGSELPSKFALEQNYPNPFNPVTNIKFSIPKAGNIKLIVFDAAGKEVAELVNGDLSAGSYNFDFSASHLSSGVYFYKLTGDGFTEVKKMILIK